MDVLGEHLDGANVVAAEGPSDVGMNHVEALDGGWTQGHRAASKPS